MRPLSVNERGILFVIGATASFSTCDTLIKLATTNFPVLESMFLRSLFAVILAVPLVAVTGEWQRMRAVFNPRVLLRGVFELTSAMAFVIGLANMPIAEITALIQLAPIFLMLAAALVLGLRVTGAQFSLAFLAFVGALFVVQPGGSSFTMFALFGVGAAVLSASRELVGRTVPVGIPGVIVALAAMAVSTVGSGAAMLAFETFRMPEAGEAGLIVASAFFMVIAQVLVFAAYRHAEPGAVAPFFYSGALWAVISSALVFGVLPNMLALTGIGLIVLSGVGVLLISRRRKQAPAA